MKNNPLTRRLPCMLCRRRREKRYQGVFDPLSRPLFPPCALGCAQRYLYSVPQGSSKKATETEAEPADSTIAKKASKKLGQSVERKASLAAIAMEEQAASDSAGNGVDEVAKEPSEAQPKPCKEPEPSKEKKKGGCCVVQ